MTIGNLQWIVAVIAMGCLVCGHQEEVDKEYIPYIYDIDHSEAWYSGTGFERELEVTLLAHARFVQIAKIATGMDWSTEVPSEQELREQFAAASSSSQRARVVNKSRALLLYTLSRVPDPTTRLRSAAQANRDASTFTVPPMASKPLMFEQQHVEETKKAVVAQVYMNIAWVISVVLLFALTVFGVVKVVVYIGKLLYAGAKARAQNVVQVEQQEQTNKSD